MSKSYFKVVFALSVMLIFAVSAEKTSLRMPWYFVQDIYDPNIAIDTATIGIWSKILEGANPDSPYITNVTEWNHLHLASNFSYSWDPNLPLFPCPLVNFQFVRCYHHLDKSQGGCRRYGGTKRDQYERTKILCEVLPGIECQGERNWLVEDVICTRFNGYRFPTVLIFSMFLGPVGVDRFYLKSWIGGAFKFCTIGGVGIWWLLDIIFVITGILRPADGSCYELWY